MRKIILFSFLIFSVLGYSQTTIKGKVVDQNDQPVSSANVVIVGKAEGVVANFDGLFTLTTSQVPPFKLKVSSIGYSSVTVDVTKNNQTLTVTLNEEAEQLGEIVISASRTPERIFESPVSVERFGLKDIKNTASSDFYDGLENLKGVDINTNSLTFKSINTRGFATFANTRFMQMVDQMDNAAPALNFPLGNLLGMTETDVLSVELLPGAASALYGANAFNGILFMRSKSPFDFEGISAYIKRGVTSQEVSGDNTYTDFGIRAAHKFSEKFAGKVNFGYLKGTDWGADNETDKLFRGFTRDDLDYDGVNVYGDEVSQNMFSVAQILTKTNNPATGEPILPAGAEALVPNVNVSRTGYNEKYLTDYNAESIKADWGLYYRPWENDFEISYVGKVGSGSTIYQGANRYAIDDFFLQQHKIEIKNDNFFLRGYMTEDKAGDSYDMVFTGININRAWKSDPQWFAEYVGTYVQSTLGGATSDQAHANARAQAESGRYLPGTPEFQAAFEKSINDPDLSSGSKFQDNSKIYHADANYNFSDIIEFADIQVGGSTRTYELNSSGTIYTDNDGPIRYSEFGIYTQIQKKLMEDRLKLTGSLRYDKSELFDGFFSPRLAAGYTLGENKNHNLRASFQTGFRNPTTQDLYIGLDVGRAILIGGAKDNLDRDVRTYGISQDAQDDLGQPATIEKSGDGAYNNSYLASSLQAFGASGNPADLKVANSNLAKPEQVTSFELGYRGKVHGVVIDLSGYYNSYKDFLSNETVVSTFYGEAGDNSLSVLALANGDYQAYQTYTNSEANVNSYGATLGLDTKVLGGFDLGANYTYSKLDFDQEVNPDFRTNFNTPEHKFKANFGKTDLFENIGFNVAYRWSDSYFWEASFGDGQVPSFSVLDAQVNITVPSIKSNFKVGASNLLGDEYFTAFGTGYVGSQYYVSWTINNL
ncbi:MULTISPECIES: TonB-dependent receptor [unclassified Cellulophaga]|uniref:TonB-dependent receptor n=1 Tax=unclassified Cellulophaga TaxID=2634405 RepID=UPI0026E3C82E|nr:MULTISPECIES: TonB-dependent receptor [unclassified Cellulophaga]MDO6493057.1 TonB-dependent receptor [Cellulophaga sp. 2_MG-2023]MDO6496310.1 TonB-dependent receptor [Cellulophaga sp. 3_MG-2023]